MRRVVVTGLGLVTPLADGVELTWKRMLSGESGIRKIENFKVDDISSRIAGQVPRGEGEGEFSAERYVSTKRLKMMDDFIVYGVAAAIQAVEDSGWKAESEHDQEMTGVMIGSGIGGLPAIEKNVIMVHENGVKRLSPFFIPSCLINLISGHVSIHYGFRGPNHSVVTACSTGAHAIGDAARLIQCGDANVMVAGGSEAAICRISVAGFAAAKALSTNFNDRPTEASRPWDRDRDGFIMGEGAGVVVLEEYEHAKKRGAKIYGEVAGYGLTGDAYHITAPHPEGRSAYRAMEMALRKSGLGLDEISYINAHGTSTPIGDEAELRTIQRLFGDNTEQILMSSTKSSIGHLLGAAGGVEAIFSLLAMRDNIAPPTLNLYNPLENNNIDLVPLKAKEGKIKTALSNSFGFGGTNACLVFKSV